MGLMDGKVALIFGVANKNSIAWGITQKLHEVVDYDFMRETISRRMAVK